MKIIAFLLAEYAALVQDNKLVIAGTFESIQVRRQPGVNAEDVRAIPLSKAFLVCVSEAMLADGLVHPVHLRVIDDDGKEVVPKQQITEIEYSLNVFGRPMRHNSVADITGMIFPGFGDYTFEWFIGDAKVADLTIAVIDMTPPA